MLACGVARSMSNRALPRLAGCLLVLIASSPLLAQTTMPTPQTAGAVPATMPSAGYELVWADEFDVDGKPNPANWTFENGFVRNQELQWYQPDNAWCENGLLIIEARKEDPARPNPRFDPNAEARNWQRSRRNIEITSSSLKTQGLQQWQFGVFEIRAKIDARPGLWPAIWTLGVNGRWPFNGEIDIMEYYRGMILANVAWGSADKPRGEWDAVRKPIAEFNDPDWANLFHVWRMDWDADSIKLYVDGLLLNETDLSRTQNPDGTNPFHQPHYLILNLALGGFGGGDMQDTKLPSRYEIDYVRVYQRRSNP